MPDHDDPFIPCYPPKVKRAFFGSIGFVVLGLLIAGAALFQEEANSQELLIGLGSAAFFGFGVAIRLTLPTKVEFNQTDLVVRRHLLPDKRIEYGNVRDLGVSRLVAESDRFYWGHMENAEELTTRIYHLVDEGVIRSEGLQGEAFTHDVDDADASVFAILATLGTVLTSGVLMFVGVLPFEWVVAFPTWVHLALLAGLSLTSYGGALLYLRRRRSREADATDSNVPEMTIFASQGQENSSSTESPDRSSFAANLGTLGFTIACAAAHLYF